MAAFHGKQGKVTFAGGAASSVLSWSIDATCDVADASVMDNSAVTAATHWKDFIAGYNSWTAIVECDLDDGGMDPDLTVDFIDDDGIDVVLHQSITGGTPTTRKYYGTGIITGISPSVDKDDVAKVTYTVQGSGQLSVAADTI